MPVVVPIHVIVVFSVFSLWPIRWKMQIDNFGRQHLCTNSKESRIKISLNCWPFVGLAYMLRVKFSLFTVQPHPRVNANKMMGTRPTSTVIRATVALLPFSSSLTIFAGGVSVIVDHFTACTKRALCSQCPI